MLFNVDVGAFLANVQPAEIVSVQRAGSYALGGQPGRMCQLLGQAQRAWGETAIGGDIGLDEGRA
jgi:hypothetical protein